MQDSTKALWRDSGVVLMLQKQISSISINGIIEIVATVPQRVGKFPVSILLDFPVRSSCLHSAKKGLISVELGNREHHNALQKSQLFWRVLACGFCSSHGRSLSSN